MRAFLVSTLMLAAMNSAALAETSTPAPAPTAKAEKKQDDEGVICRRERPTGSNRAIRICTTALQRDLDKTNADRLLNDRAPVLNGDVGGPPK